MQNTKPSTAVRSHLGSLPYDEAQRRPAVAHHAGARPAAHVGPEAPVAFGVDTGMLSTGPTVQITKRGTAFVALHSGGVARSQDAGASWQKISPPARGVDSHRGAEHGFVWLDETTQRLYYLTHGQIRSGKPKRFFHLSTGSFLSWTDDEGETWDNAVVGRDCWDWPKIMGGPPVRSAMAEYPNALYFHASYPFVLGPLSKVYKSLDGGKTWQGTKSLASDGLEAGYGVVGSDGTIYIDQPYFAALYARLFKSPYLYRWRDQGKLRLLISDDEGDSWQHVVIPDAHAPTLTHGIQRVAIDEDDNLYFVWTDSRDGLPYLSISRDRGRTWGKRLMVAPPGVKSSHLVVSVAARGRGHIAISYFGSRQRSGLAPILYLPDLRPHDGYITECFDALADEPLFWSAAVNDAERPLLPRWRISDGVGEGLGVTFGPDGTPWATFLRVVDRWRPGPAVLKRRAPTTVFVGRLLHASVEPEASTRG